MGCHPTGALRVEHRLILKVVGVLEAILDRGPGADAGADAGRDLRACTEFFRLFTDRMHHGKEEDILFQALVEEGFPRHAGPIAMMLEEHQLGRSLVRQLDEALDALAAHPAAWRDVERAGRAYIDLLRQHIGKEDDGLFETADRAVSEPACRALCRAYDEVSARRFDGRATPDLERLAAELIARYG